MNSFKKFAAGTVAVAVLVSAGAVFASEFKRPVEIASELTGQSVESLREQRLAGETYGEIVEAYEVRDAFRAKMLEQKKAILDERVESGSLTQEEADKIYDALLMDGLCDEEKQMLFGEELSARFGKGFHMREDGQGKRENMQNRLDGQGKQMHMNQAGQGRGTSRGAKR